MHGNAESGVCSTLIAGISKLNSVSFDKTYPHKHQTQIFEGLAPPILSLLKEHIILGHAVIMIINHS